jgi:hypothetical protein
MPDARNTILDNVRYSTRKSWSWVRAQAFRYLLRPNAATRAHAQAFARRVFPSALPRPLAAMFVRASDKGQESRVFNVSDYFALLDPVAARIGLRDVYLNSDSEAVIDDARRLAGARYRIHVPAVAHDFAFASLGAMSWAQKARQMNDSLADLYLEVTADVHVGTLSSNWCRLVDALKISAGKDAFPFLDVDARYLVEGARRRA